ncbi:uncharacterized protein LOC110095043 [Dendrobium catenatum]|uniref:uncharacterized protein LOC110095043 n=1 Tax=Dendrobium catenatum TaxID=906689 RepID=UPI0009F2F30E|nr:uncharacterized protein LOC110095043 [Dendrobium catenatum]
MSSLIFWNCRGVKKKETALYLKEVVRDNYVFYVGLAETKASKINKTDVCRIIGNSWDFFHQPAVGTAEGILIMWDSNLASFTAIEHTSQVVFGALTTPNKGLWHVAMVYGHKDFQIRRDLWNRLDKVMMIDVPTIVGGDFNCLLSSEDKIGGKQFKMTKGTEEMKSFMENQDLHDLSVTNPVAFKLDDTMHSHSKTFRFEDTWRSYPATKGIVAKAWNKYDYGDDSEVLNRKIKRTLKSLFFWNRNKCKSLNQLKDELKNDILKLQLQEDEEGGLCPEDLDTLCSKVREFNVTLVRLSTGWNHRAKAKWNEDGDTNSRFYHAYATARKNGKLIRQIKDENNTTVEELDKIESVFLKFFEDKWKPRNRNIQNWPKIDHKQQLDNADIDCLNSVFSETEFFNAISQQGSNKSPGLDGSTSSFFKFYWDIIKDTT